MNEQLGDGRPSGDKKQLFVFHYIFIRRLIFLSMLIDFEGGGGQSSDGDTAVKGQARGKN